MTKSIGVILYSYKGKMIKDVVANLLSNASGENQIKIYISEQHPIIKDEYFNEIPEVSYSHVFWDHPYGSCEKKIDLINKAVEDYILVISDIMLLNKNWDKVLVEYVGDKDVVVSGIGKFSLKQDRIFYIDSEYSHDENFTLSNFVDNNLIFTTKQVFNKTRYPNFLKYKGENEYLSIYWYTAGINIFSAPSSIGLVVGKNSLDLLYVPYSIHHNYNEVINFLLTGKSEKIKLENNRSLQDFILFHNIDLSKINPLPFQTNDVEYDCYQTKFDDLDGRKFLGRTRAIY